MTGLFDLSGRRAVVTGASRGLGQYLGRALARAGADLVITGRDQRDCTEFEREIRALGRDVASFSLEVREEESIRAFGRQVLERFDRIDILVNNAGCNIRKPALDITWADWNKVLDTNLRGAFFLCQAIGRAMVAQGYGRIINIGSVTSVSGCGGITPYSASRGGVLQMTEALSDEWGPSGVTVNVLAPGWFKTEQTSSLYEKEEWLAYLTDRVHVRRPGRPSDLDGAVVFLASDASEYVTGQILLVDGGISTGSVRVAPDSR